MNTEQRRFSKREWWLVILVIVIGEYLLLDKIFKYGANEGIVGYISFAGTIVSIILAVLAIVYSYYQNFSQQRDSNNIATQIDLLRNTVNEVRISKSEFGKELERINDVSDKVDQSISILSESRAHVSKLSSEVENLKSLLEAPVTTKATSSEKNILSQNELETFFFRCNELTQFCILFSEVPTRC